MRALLSRGAGAVALAAFVLLPASVLAQPYQGETGSLIASDASPEPGGTVVVSGSGFAPGSEVEITIESTPVSLETVSADAEGAISVTVTIPADMSPGEHVLKATGVTPDGATLVLSTDVMVSGSGAQEAGTSEGLPRTLTMVGVVLVGILAVAAVGLFVRVR